MELDISGKKDQKHYNRRDQEAKKTEFWEDYICEYFNHQECWLESY